jgi:type II secretory pathway component GspD/PulD (secretin)
MPRIHTHLAALLTFLAALSAHSRPQTQTPPLPDAGPRIAIAPNLDLARLVDLTASTLALRIEYDPAALKGQVTLRTPGALSADELWDLCNRQLHARGFTTIRPHGSDSFVVVPLSSAAGSARLEPGVTEGGTTRALPSHRRAGFEAILYRPLQSPEKTLETARLLLSKPAGAVQTLDAGLLLIAHITPRLDILLDTLRTIDAQRAGFASHEYTPRHARADALIAAARKVLALGGTIVGEAFPSADGRTVLIIAPPPNLTSWAEALELCDRAEPIETRLYDPGVFPARDLAALLAQILAPAPPPMTSDPISGALLVSAVPQEHERIASIIASLRDAPGAESRSIQRFEIRHRPAPQVLAVLQRLIAAGALGLQSDHAPVGAGRAPAPSTLSVPSTSADSLISTAPGQPVPPVQLTLDEGTSSILAIGPPRLLERLARLVADLDVRQRQVRLDVLLLSLSQSEARDLGIELRGQGTSGDLSFSLASLFGLASAPGDGIPAIGSGAGLSGVLLSPGEFNLVLRALEVVSEGRTLSMPSILVGNLEQATINSVLQQPFASVNASDTVATTSFGGTQDAGTQVSLTPQLSSADHVILEYSISLSTFVGESPSPGLPPPRQQNNLRSVVTLPDGCAIAIGGIELSSTADADSRVPLLGRIPLLGSLARSRSRSEGRQRFYAFIRPTILRDDLHRDLMLLSDRAASEAGLPASPPLSPTLLP